MSSFSLLFLSSLSLCRGSLRFCSLSLSLSPRKNERPLSRLSSLCCCRALSPLSLSSTSHAARKEKEGHEKRKREKTFFSSSSSSKKETNGTRQPASRLLPKIRLCRRRREENQAGYEKRTRGGVVWLREERRRERDEDEEKREKIAPCPPIHRRPCQELCSPFLLLCHRPFNTTVNPPPTRSSNGRRTGAFRLWCAVKEAERGPRESKCECCSRLLPFALQDLFFSFCSLIFASCSLWPFLSPSLPCLFPPHPTGPAAF